MLVHYPSARPRRRSGRRHRRERHGGWIARVEQGRGLDRIQRAAGRDVAPGIADPLACDRVIGDAQDFGERDVDLAGIEPPRRPLQPLARQGGRRALAADANQIAELALQRGPPILVGPRAGQLRADLLQAGLQLLERDRLEQRFGQSNPSK
jgi:hypothetical protein